MRAVIAPAVPLRPATRAWLSDLYACKAARLYSEGVPLPAAKAEARTLALSFRDAFRDGTLIDMDAVGTVREIAPKKRDWEQMSLGGEAA